MEEGKVPGSTHESESQYTMAQRSARQIAGCADIPSVPPQYHQEMPPSRWEEVRQKVRDLWSEAVPPETAYHLSPEDEVGTFDIGEANKVSREDAVHHFEQDWGDKGPGFEARLKNMEDKLPMSLLSPIFLEGIARVLQHGSRKYAANMWRDEPMPFCAELDSIFRHLFAFLRCEDFDPDSGELHLFNAACRLMFLSERYFTHPELDDRYPSPGLNKAHFESPPIPDHEVPPFEEQLDNYSRGDLYNLIESQAELIDTLTEEE